ncbi:hypothetical protein MASR2M48_15670 [Spirochaetota bacterium]
MAFVQFTGVSLAFGARDILYDAALFMASGTKAALAGPNGAGKTTLLRIIAGLLPPDSGERAVQKGTRVSYLAQSGEAYSGCTVYEEAEKAYGALEALCDGTRHHSHGTRVVKGRGCRSRKLTGDIPSS